MTRIVLPARPSIASVSDSRFGLELLYHAQASPSVDVWFGGGFGWEWLRISANEAFQGQTAKFTTRANGMQLLMLQAGLDFMALPTLGIGPFIGFSNDMYFNASDDCEGACAADATDSASIDSKVVHHWLFLGVRGSYRP